MIAPNNQLSVEDPDARLMVRVGQGDDAAFGELLRRHKPRIIGLVQYLLGNHTDAEDVAQEVFLRAYRARRNYVPTARFSAWLFTITRNVVLNARRRLVNRRETTIPAGASRQDDFPSIDEPSSELEPWARAAQKETVREVRKAIKQLRGFQRQAVQLVYLEGCCYRTAALQLKVSESAVKSLVCRGKSKLRAILATHVDPDGNESSPLKGLGYSETVEVTIRPVPVSDRRSDHPGAPDQRTLVRSSL